MHDLTIISVLAGALAVALAFGWLTRRLGLSPLVGYLLAGIAVGPHTPGFVADVRLAAQLAEIGVILLMFGVGLHLRLQDLLRVWRVAVPGALGQSACAAALGLGVALAFGWGAGAGLVLGMSLAVASTVMLMRMLSERDLLRTPDGHVAVGWLLVEDLLTVAALVVLPALASGEDSGLPAAVALAVAKAVGFALLVAALGPRVLSPLLEHMAGTRSAELFTLSVFVLALSIASLAAAAFHVSVPLGAFLGGLVVAQSRVGQQAATEMLPFRDVFSALFFVSVGMLFDPGFVLANPGITLAALGVILIAKPLAALAIVRLLGQPLATGLTVAIGLAQIGEFSFILAGLALALGVLPQSGFDLVVAGALVSTALNPLLFKALPVLSRRLNAPARRAHPQALAVPAAAEGPHILVVGYGETGRRLCERLLGDGVDFVLVDADWGQFEAAQARGLRSVYGDAGRPELLRLAGLGRARVLVLTGAGLPARMRACLAARQVNPGVSIVCGATSAAERAWLEEFGVAAVVDEPQEVAAALYDRLASGLGAAPQGRLPRA